TGAAPASTASRGQLAQAQSAAMQLASRPDVARAFRSRDGSGLELSSLPAGLAVVLSDSRGVFFGRAPGGPAWRTSAELVPRSGDRRVTVYVALDGALVGRVADTAPIPEGVQVSLVVGRDAIGAP